MSRLLEAIDHEIEAADALLRACARRGALADTAENGNPFVTALRRQFSIASMTPNDMLAALGKMK